MFVAMRALKQSSARRCCRCRRCWWCVGGYVGNFAKVIELFHGVWGPKRIIVDDGPVRKDQLRACQATGLAADLTREAMAASECDGAHVHAHVYTRGCGCT